jgi:phage/plasmid primase-like uncharacterized protein
MSNDIHYRVDQWLTSIGVDTSAIKVDLSTQTQRLPAIGKDCQNKSAMLNIHSDRIVYYAHDGQGTTHTLKLAENDLSKVTINPQTVETSQERNQRESEVAAQSLSYWNTLQKNSKAFSHYLGSKDIDAMSCFNIRVNEKNELIIPLYSVDGEMRNLQKIFRNKDKSSADLFPKRPVFQQGQWKGLAHFHSECRITSAYLVVEGWATGYSAQEMINNYGIDVCVVSAMSAQGIKDMVKRLSDAHPNSLIILGLDNDRNKSSASEVAVKDLLETLPFVMPQTDGYDFDDVRRKYNGNQKLNEFIEPLRLIIENNKPIATLRYVDAPVGAGKTYTFVHDIIGKNLNEIYLYVAPTVDLLNQTERQITEAFPDLKVVKIISEEGMKGSVRDKLVKQLEECVVYNIPCVVLATHISFLNIVGGLASSIKNKLRVYADEAFTTVFFFNMKYGNNQDAILNNFETFGKYVDVSIQGKVELKPHVRQPLTKLAQGDIISIFNTDAKKALSTAGYICEGFPSSRLKVYLENEGVWPPTLNESAFSDGYDEDSNELKFLVGGYVDPKVFKGFKTFTLMSANFTTHLLASLWKSLNVELVPDEDFSRLKDTHTLHGHRMKFYYMSERASMSFLDQSYVGAEPEFGVEPNGEDERMVKRFIKLIEKHMPSDYLLQVNNKYYEDFPEFIDGLDKATRIKMDVAGNNSFRHYDNIAILGVINPNGQNADWWVKRTGLPIYEIRQNSRLHSIYQALGRTSMRDASATRPMKVVVLGKQDAEWLHQQFPNSQLCGYWPESEEAALKTKVEPHKDADYKKHAKVVEEYLETHHGSDNVVHSSVVLEGTQLTKHQHSRAVRAVSGWHKKGHYYHRNEKVDGY